MSQLTPKQRILMTLRGEKADRIPFSPFLAYYFESLDEETRQKGQLVYLEAMGADPLLRGSGCAWKTASHKCSAASHVKGGVSVTQIHTPHGVLTSEHTYAPGADTWFITRHPVRDIGDLKLLAYYIEDLTVEENIAEYNAMRRGLGERALDMPLVGLGSKTGFQSLVESWVGTVNLAYLVYDYPDELMNLVCLMGEKSMETVRYTLESDAECAIFWEDTSTTNISPGMYDRYVAPEISRWAEAFNKNGKLLIQHACGHLKHVLPAMTGQGIHGIESVSPKPTGDVTVDEIFALTPADMAIIGGIEPLFLLKCGMSELEELVERLIFLSKSRRYVMANSDSCPPGVEYGKFLRIAEIVKSKGGIG
jgi:uroporphyrinogen-III decarboxylase